MLFKVKKCTRQSQFFFERNVVKKCSTINIDCKKNEKDNIFTKEWTI